MARTKVGVMTAVVAEDAPKVGLCVGDRFLACGRITGLEPVEIVEVIPSQWDAANRLAAGSPAGNGSHYDRCLTPGDVMEVSVEKLGEHRINCVAFR